MYGRERIYKKVEIIGVSSKSIEAAIETALTKAQSSLDKLSWFEVQDIRGHIGDDGKIAEYREVANVGPAFVELGFAPERTAKILAKEGATLKKQPDFKRHVA